MTTIYLIRHADPDYNVLDSEIRPLTKKGYTDRKKITSFFVDKEVDVVFSSHYKRSIDTIHDFAKQYDYEINIDERFCERIRNTVGYLPDSMFKHLMKKLWNDFNYKNDNEESLYDLQKRGIRAINDILRKYKNQKIIIGMHLIIISVIIKKYNPQYSFDDLWKLKDEMPFIVKLLFNDYNCVSIERYDLFNNCTYKIM
ncbi:MAG: histidine phosphatase family protein [Oscillospiraceae bacterium]|jgi:2,3-bisphosphoglycerate-dependent phosphoglycerate mutase|nr:histidine phosphatase family protein [Oscillospiraceae bacterium]